MAKDKNQGGKRGNKHAQNTHRTLRKYGRAAHQRTGPAKAGKRKVYSR